MLDPRTDPAPKVMVVVDDREQNREVIEALQAHPGVALAFRRLPLGDYQIDNRCLIERKTVSDFACSIIDGRLFSQAKRLAAAIEATAIILEGKASDLATIGLQREAWQGAMVSLTIIFGIPVLRALDAAETARLIVYTSNQIHRQRTGLVSLHYTRPKKKRTTQLRLLQGLPGAGPRAKTPRPFRQRAECRNRRRERIADGLRDWRENRGQHPVGSRGNAVHVWRDRLV